MCIVATVQLGLNELSPWLPQVTFISIFTCSVVTTYNPWKANAAQCSVCDHSRHPANLIVACQKTTRMICEEPSRLTNEQKERKKKIGVQQLPQDGSVNSWRLAQHWQMLPNQSLPSALTGTEDRTVLYWTEVESGSARAVERIDQPVDSPHRSRPKTFCWLLFVSVSSSLPGDCSLASALVSARPCWGLGLGGAAAV